MKPSEWGALLSEQNQSEKYAYYMTLCKNSLLGKTKTLEVMNDQYCQDCSLIVTNASNHNNTND